MKIKKQIKKFKKLENEFRLFLNGAPSPEISTDSVKKSISKKAQMPTVEVVIPDVLLKRRQKTLDKILNYALSK